MKMNKVCRCCCRCSDNRTTTKLLLIVVALSLVETIAGRSVQNVVTSSFENDTTQNITKVVDDFKSNDTFTRDGVIIQEYHQPEDSDGESVVINVKNKETKRINSNDAIFIDSKRQHENEMVMSAVTKLSVELQNAYNEISETELRSIKNSRLITDNDFNFEVNSDSYELNDTDAKQTDDVGNYVFSFTDPVTGEVLQADALTAEVPEKEVVEVEKQKPQNAKLVSGTPGLVRPVTNRTVESYLNATAFFVENDEVDNSFTYLQTLFLACFATLTPLVLSLIVAFGLRFLWRMYRRERGARGFTVALPNDASTDPLAKTRPVSNEELKNSESQFSMTVGEEISGSPVLNFNPAIANHTTKNGNLITMTLKNNHLIVETEERNDIVRDGRENSMKYSSGEQDGVYVVEVSSPPYPSFTKDPLSTSPEPDSKQSNQVIVHHPPDGVGAGYSDEEILEIDEDFCISTKSVISPRGLHNTRNYGSANTGLSQSDLSLSSSNSYRYGEQQAYETGHYGYPIYDYSDNLNGVVEEKTDPDKPIITAAIFKQESIDIGRGYADRLESDIYARATRIKEAEDLVKHKEDVLLEEQRMLGNGNGNPSIIVDDAKTSSESELDSNSTVVENITKKDIFNNIKQGLVSSEPQFEKLCNDPSPVQEIEKDITSIDPETGNGKATLNEEYDNRGFSDIETAES